MVGQIVAAMFLQVFIERARRIARAHGYSPLILCEGKLSSIQISASLDTRFRVGAAVATDRPVAESPSMNAAKVYVSKFPVRVPTKRTNGGNKDPAGSQKRLAHGFVSTNESDVRIGLLAAAQENRQSGQIVGVDEVHIRVKHRAPEGCVVRRAPEPHAASPGRGLSSRCPSSASLRPPAFHLFHARGNSATSLN